MHFRTGILWLLIFCVFESFGNSSARNIISSKFQIIGIPDVAVKEIKNGVGFFPYYQFSDPPKIAFLADVHLQDVYADLEDSDFKGVLNPDNGKYATIRTMAAQLNSTRLFNENYFAFHSALEDLLDKGIKYVVMPGDFTDDGQPMNIKALKAILKDYQDKYGMRFFLSTGNHDPVRPFTIPGGKNDFMGQNGRPKALASSDRVYKEVSGDQLPVSLTEQISHLGYKEIMDELSDYGFFPNKKDLFWTHPFIEFDYDNYEFQHTKEGSTLDNRVYEVGNTGHFLPDASYLVEPEEGIWLLAIDANVFLQTNNKSKAENTTYGGNGIGFNQNGDGFHYDFYRFSRIFLKLLDGEPADSFSIDLHQDIISDLQSNPSLIPAP